MPNIEQGSFRDRFKKRGLALIGSSAGTAVGAASEQALPGSGALAAIATNWFVLFMLSRTNERAFNEVERLREEIAEVAEKTESLVDLDFIFSDEYQVELRRFLEYTARTERQHKLTCLRNFMLHRACGGSLNGEAATVATLVGHFIDVLPEDSLRMLMQLPAPGLTGSEYLVVDQLATRCSVSVEMAEIMILDLASRRLAKNWRPEYKGPINYPPIKPIWGLTQMGQHVSKYINPIGTA